MKRLTLAVLLALLAVPTFAQTPVVANMAADDSSNVAILIRYYPGVSSNNSAS